MEKFSNKNTLKYYYSNKQGYSKMNFHAVNEDWRQFDRAACIGNIKRYNHHSKHSNQGDS